MTPDPTLDRRFPDTAALEAAALRRIPGFARDYLSGGIGAETCLARNRADLDRTLLDPRYLVEDGAWAEEILARNDWITTSGERVYIDPRTVPAELDDPRVTVRRALGK